MNGEEITTMVQQNIEGEEAEMQNVDVAMLSALSVQ